MQGNARYARLRCARLRCARLRCARQCWPPHPCDPARRRDHKEHILATPIRWARKGQTRGVSNCSTYVHQAQASKLPAGCRRAMGSIARIVPKLEDGAARGEDSELVPRVAVHDALWTTRRAGSVCGQRHTKGAAAARLGELAEGCGAAVGHSSPEQGWSWEWMGTSRALGVAYRAQRADAKLPLAGE